MTTTKKPVISRADRIERDELPRGVEVVYLRQDPGVYGPLLSIGYKYLIRRQDTPEGGVYSAYREQAIRTAWKSFGPKMGGGQ